MLLLVATYLRYELKTLTAYLNIVILFCSCKVFSLTVIQMFQFEVIFSGDLTVKSTSRSTLSYAELNVFVPHSRVSDHCCACAVSTSPLRAMFCNGYRVTIYGVVRFLCLYVIRVIKVYTVVCYRA
jgi:hypothetical protein